MIEKSLAQPTRTIIGETYATEDARYSRGVAIATNRLREIKRLETGCYCVPAFEPSKAYVVTVKPVEACSCPDSLYSGNRCKHRHAVRYMLKMTGVCSGCGERHFNRELVEVVDSLTYFDGDRLCENCLYCSDATSV